MIKAEIRQQLVDHYLDFYTLAYSMLADSNDARDAVQEALTRTMTKSRLNDPLNYCYKILRHTAIDIIRHRRRFVQLDEHKLTDIAEDEHNNYASLLEQVVHLRNNLPQAQRIIVRLHDEQGLSYKEISRLTGKSIVTIRRQLNQAHETVREEMKKETTI